MNELNTRLLEYLPDPNTVKDGIGNVVEVLQTEAPLLVKEIMNWVGFLSFAGFACCLLSIFLFLYLWKKLWKIAITFEAKCLAAKDSSWSGVRMCNLLFLIPIAILFVRLWYQLDWLQILIAPRLFLLEYISNLL
jgi:hypothetical protein